MSFQRDSSWAILDPSLSYCNITDYRPDRNDKASYLEISLPIRGQQAEPKIKQLRNIPHNDNSEPKRITKNIPEKPKEQLKEKKTQKDTVLERCLKNVEEIDTELFYYKDSIFAEKMKALEAELLSIENGTHPTLVEEEREAKKKYKNQLQNIENVYNYEKTVLDNKIDEEIQTINNDIERQILLAQNILRSEIPNIHPNSFNKKRKENSSGKEVYFRKIELKKKVSKLQSIHERQVEASRRKKPETVPKASEEDALSDFLLIEKKIMEKTKGS